jgi:hypothetical protein
MIRRHRGWFMITRTLLREPSRWLRKIEKKMTSEGLARCEQSDLDFLNDRLPRFESEKGDSA